MASDKPIFYLLKSIRANEFATINIGKIDLTAVKLDNQFLFGIIPEARQIQVIYKLTFSFETKPFIILEVICGFELEEVDFNKFTDTKAKAITLPKDLMVHLSIITVGTARGILHTKLETTEFSMYMLPMINVPEILTQDVVFRLEPASKS